MFYNYVKIAFRNLLRNRVFSAINIAGLAVGVAASLLLFVTVSYESSFDAWQPKAKRIYRVVLHDRLLDGTMSYTAGNPLPAAAALRLDLPQLERLTSVHGTLNPQVTVLGRNPNNPATDKKYIEDRTGLMLEPAFFDLFAYRWLAGSPRVLANPDVVVLTRAKAEKYFGDWKNAVGQYLKLNNSPQGVVQVQGVLENLPPNTDFPMDIVLSYETHRRKPDLFGFGGSDSWQNWGSTSSNDQNFVLLPAGQSPERINALLAGLSRKYFTDRRRAVRTLHLSPLADQHFDKRFENFSEHTTDRAVLATLTLIGVLVVLMACINFVNLATAQAVGRAKEVGLRKVVGGNRWQLVVQFMAETGVMVVFAVGLGAGLAQAALPLLGHLSEVPAELPFLGTPRVWVFLAGLAVVVTGLAGFYPAWVMSGFGAAQALKSKASLRTVGGVPLRRGLVVVQFAISQLLIIGTLVAVSQMDYIRRLDLGFEKEGVYVVQVDPALQPRWDHFRNKLLQDPAVAAVSFMSDVPSSDNKWSSNFAFQSGDDKDFHTFIKLADAAYFSTFGLQFVAGGPYRAGDSARSFVINETMCRRLGLRRPQEALGKVFRLGSGRFEPVVGVVKDFKATSAREAVSPLVITTGRDMYGYAAVKLRGDLAGSVARIQRLYDGIFPEVAFFGHFFDETIEAFYHQEKQLTLAYQLFAGVAVFISCLGLYGLVSFMAERRTKEIGIRKVLGASVWDIVRLFAREFTLLVGAACLISIPVAWYMMHGWLENFAYRIRPGIGFFAATAVASLLLAWATVGYRAVRAALANPVKSLRSE